MSVWLHARLQRALVRLAALPGVEWVQVWGPGGQLCHVAGSARSTSGRLGRPLPGGAELRLAAHIDDAAAHVVDDAVEWIHDILQGYALPQGPPGLSSDLAIRWESMVAANSDAAIVVRQDGVIEFANAAAVRQFADAPLIGTTLAQVQSRRRNREGAVIRVEDSPVMRTFTTGLPQEELVGFVQQDASLAWYNVRTAFFDDSRTRVLATLTDITSLKNARDEAGRREALLRATFGALGDGILVMDDRYTIVDANPAAEEILGLSLEELRNPAAQPLTKVFREDGSPLPLHEWPAYRAIARGERVRGVLLELLRKDGRRRWMLMNAERVEGAVGAVVSFADVTALQGARAHAVAASVRWRALMDNLEEAVIVYDAVGAVVDLNQSAERILGLTRERLAAGPVAFPPDIRVVDEHGHALAERPSELCRRTGAPVTGVIAGMVRPDGIRWYVNSAVPLPDGGTLLSLVDVTAIRNAGAELERRKDEFISTLSHELRTPLTSLDGALTLLAAGVGGAVSPDAEGLLALARRSSARLIRLVGDILDLERITAGGITIRSARHTVASLVEASVDAARLVALAHRQAILVGAIPPVEVLTDSDRVAQILGNFLANAIQFSPDGATIEADARVVGRFVRINIRDHGPGVPEEFVPRLFGRFAQAPNTSGRTGAGLGLSICRAVAGALGGEVGYERAAEGGALFWLILPRVTE